MEEGIYQVYIPIIGSWRIKRDKFLAITSQGYSTNITEVKREQNHHIHFYYANNAGKAKPDKVINISLKQAILDDFKGAAVIKPFESLQIIENALEKLLHEKH